MIIIIIAKCVSYGTMITMIMMNHNDNIVIFEIMIIIIIAKCASYGTMIAKLDATVLIVALSVAVSSCRNRLAPLSLSFSFIFVPSLSW